MFSPALSAIVLLVLLGLVPAASAAVLPVTGLSAAVAVADEATVVHLSMVVPEWPAGSSAWFELSAAGPCEVGCYALPTYGTSCRVSVFLGVERADLDELREWSPAATTTTPVVYAPLPTPTPLAEHALAMRRGGPVSVGRWCTVRVDVFATYGGKTQWWIGKEEELWPADAKGRLKAYVWPVKHFPGDPATAFTWRGAFKYRFLVDSYLGYQEA